MTIMKRGRFLCNNGDVPIWIALIPFATLVAILALVIKCFGADAINGGSQIALIISAAVGAMLSITLCGTGWQRLEEAITENIHTSASAIIILLLIGAVASSWMLSGIVPTMIYYGLKIIHPMLFLGVACIICAVVSLVTGSSWTTIATVGVALMGIGENIGYSEGWTAGAIISGAYFGDKMSALSDTTVLASSAARVPLFEHIRYMLITTMPSFLISLVVFFIVGACGLHDVEVNTEAFSAALTSTFNITPWTLIVPLITALLILRRLPALVTLFATVAMATIMMLIFQPQIVETIGGSDSLSAIRAILITCGSETAIETGNVALNDLVTTGGMGGMLNTIWLILCAMCFGGVMAGSGMIASLTRFMMHFAHRPTSTVATTLTTGILCNLTTADQYISIIITGNTFQPLYRRRGLEGRLLSRSVEDSATVTSVLIPWNSCGMTQSTVLNVATLTYLPYCLFNIISPIMSLVVAAIGYKIYRTPKTSTDE